MTTPLPALAVSPDNRLCLEVLAENDGCTPEEFVDGSLTLALFSARTVLNNELDEKHVTGLLIVEGGVLHDAYNLSVILRSQDEVPPIGTIPMGIEDPFADAEPTPLNLNAALLQDAQGICVELGTSLGLFVSTAIDVRCIVTEAFRSRRRALLETSEPEEYIDLTGFLEGE